MPTAERCGKARRWCPIHACSCPPLLPSQTFMCTPSASSKPCPISLLSVDSEASQAVKSRRAVEAAAERVPSWRVLAALGLRVLPPARLRGPHLLRAQHPQEALSAGPDHCRRDCGVQANRGELIRGPPGSLWPDNHTKKMSIFFKWNAQDHFVKTEFVTRMLKTYLGNKLLGLDY